MNPWVRLCNAVVYQACIDYANSLNGKGNNCETVKRECEKFFLSQDFCIYSNMDGEAIMHMIQGGKKRKHNYKYRGM